ncbi:phospho-N-acetylmuramoyl-pentapeptide-transferase [Rubinisphaera sp. JC750]|uniref:phospho-N-acetylmuramoyl-pentapeptide- transferase n=1 Tax=Rubinisphaera sp. JC750 TaxID=2898658 RepID=UPI001F0239A0|nr:phospho-N-acetylmuramoyl-pentapeptide-transferase [Rubinisphaera sp. JC750]
MVLWLLRHVWPLFQQVERHTSGDSRVYLTFRIAMASVTAFLLALLFGPLAIRWLKKHFRERVASASTMLDTLHAGKNDTPTMGGVFILASVVLSTLIWGNLGNGYVLLCLFVAISFLALGAIDDWTKLSTKTKGLTARTKFRVQWVLALIAGGILYGQQSQVPAGLDLVWPIGNFTLSLGIGFIFWAALVIVATSNSVNLTDGLDGLAGGATVFSGGAYIALCYLAGHTVLSSYFAIPHIPGAGEAGVVIGALVGAMLGFLWYNCHPAQVFMGDAGSLPVGALLGLAALITRQEVLLIIIGGVFVVETLSVILQVGSYKLTGKRILVCSPLHNHFVLSGQNEMKVVIRFWICSALLSILALASLKIL